MQDHKEFGMVGKMTKHPLLLIALIPMIACDFFFPAPPEPGYGDDRLIEYFGSLSTEDVQSIRIITSNCTDKSEAGGLSSESVPSFLKVLSRMKSLDEKPLGESRIGVTVVLALKSGEVVRVRRIGFSGDGNEKYVSVLHHGSYHALFISDDLEKWIANYWVCSENTDPPVLRKESIRPVPGSDRGAGRRMTKRENASDGHEDGRE